MKFKLVESLPTWIHELNDDGKLRTKYRNKCSNADKEGIKCLLTFEQYCQLAKDAGIKSSQIGFSTSDKYVLARYNDSGDYTIDNCRFITQLENARERKVSERSREASRRNAAKMNASQPANKGELIRKGMLSSERCQEIKKQAAERAAVRDALKHPSYKGTKNSQFGTYWITDGSTNMKWSDAQGSIPDGYRRGRVLKK